MEKRYEQVFPGTHPSTRSKATPLFLPNSRQRFKGEVQPWKSSYHSSQPLLQTLSLSHTHTVFETFSTDRTFFIVWYFIPRTYLSRMAASKSSHTVRNLIFAVLTLWSIIALIIIVVWATSPDLKGASECNANLKTLKEKFAKEKDVWSKDRHALEELVGQGRLNQSLLLTRIDQLKDQLQSLNQSLESCQQQNVSLSGSRFLPGGYYSSRTGRSTTLSCPWGVLKCFL